MSILDIIFPKRCYGCGRIGAYFCDRCRKNIRRVYSNEALCPMCGHSALDGVTHPRCRTRHSPDGLTSFFHYDGMVRTAIKSIKYHNVTDLAREFIQLLPLAECDATVLIPVPLHPYRFKTRGYNQAEVLGRLVAEKLHIPMRTDILMRVRNAPPQVGLKERGERLRNMEKVFAIRRTFSDSVVLFDDVFTTGATMRACAKVLKRGGVPRVWAVTIAR